MRQTAAIRLEDFEVIAYRDAYSRWLIVWHMWQGIWEIGHSKAIPDTMTDIEALDIARRFVSRDLPHTEYNQLLPKGRD